MRTFDFDDDDDDDGGVEATITTIHRVVGRCGAVECPRHDHTTTVRTVILPDGTVLIHIQQDNRSIMMPATDAREMCTSILGCIVHLLSEE